MAVFAMLVASISFSLTGGASAELTPLVHSKTMQSLLGSVIPAKQVFATAGPKGRALAAGSNCPMDDAVSIEDSSFSSTGCYVDTAIADGYLYTEYGIEPNDNGTGWSQGVIYAVQASPSTPSASSSSPSSSINVTTLNRALSTLTTTSSIGSPSSIGGPTSTNPDADVDDDTTSDTWTGDESCENISSKRDGACNPGNNNQGCDFDGGDCCECTCVSSDYMCGEEGFSCFDPDAPCVAEDDYDGYCELPADKSDGFCDTGNNNAGCQFDGGDCCPISCIDTDTFVCGDQADFHCIDPNPISANHTLDLFSLNSSSSTTEMLWVSTYIPAFDGQPLELATMEYICVSSSVEIGVNPANAASWSCATLSESSSGSSAVFEEMPESIFSVQCGCDGTAVECQDIDWKTDGACDFGNNNAGCDYDGGDCCPCTCVDTRNYICSEYDFQCIDPTAPCVEDAVPYNGTCSSPAGAADGFCDDGNNNAGCNYDEGDCCECTCVPTDDYLCEAFNCIDPSATCESSTSSGGSDNVDLSDPSSGSDGSDNVDLSDPSSGSDGVDVSDDRPTKGGNSTVADTGAASIATARVLIVAVTVISTGVVSVFSML